MTYRSYNSYVVKICTALALALPVSALANAIVGTPIDWDANPPTAAWAAQGDPAAATVSENDSGADDFLQISFADISMDPGATWDETASGAASDLFAGTWDTGYWVEFDFWAESVVPASLQIRWADSDAEDGRYWANTITPGGTGWSSLRTDPFSDLASWRTSPFVDAADLLEDLESIDWIGVYIFRDGTDAEVYGVDDMGLMVPEPAEYLMLAAALATALLVVRRQRLGAVSVQVA
ncbi:MAG: PEP-CTERM sorting domain-containing protein [Verrucomicrobia bacterium]|nr:PEP-CTERM sorting domain-containing protein [Verrucomicrobiota bacterium]